MKTIRYNIFFGSLLLLSVALISGCSKKENIVVTRNNSGLSFQGMDGERVNDSLVWPTSISVNLNVKIDSSYDYGFDFGNGQTSDAPHPVPIYNDPGIYTISMYTNKSGWYDKDTVRKTIIVEDRRLQSIKVNNIDWERSDLINNEIPTDAHVGVFFQIVSSDDYSFQKTTQVFKSKTVDNITRNSTVVIPVDTIAYLPSHFTRKIYGYCLYGTYKGKNYLLSTSWESGVSSSFYDTKTVQSGNSFSFTTQYTIGMLTGAVVLYGSFQYP